MSLYDETRDKLRTDFKKVSDALDVVIMDIDHLSIEDLYRRAGELSQKLYAVRGEIARLR